MRQGLPRKTGEALPHYEKEYREVIRVQERAESGTYSVSSSEWEYSRPFRSTVTGTRSPTAQPASASFSSSVVEKGRKRQPPGAARGPARLRRAPREARDPSAGWVALRADRGSAEAEEVPI